MMEFINMVQSYIKNKLSYVLKKILFNKWFCTVLFFSINCFSFPETVRHGYLSCVSCHYSPTGSGLLTYYGKSISQELYSSMSNSKQNSFMDEEPPWWRVGAQLRLMQLFTDTPSMQKARFFPMQTEVMAAFSKNKFTLVGSQSYWRTIDSGSKELKPYLRNLYGIYKYDDLWSLRIGKFRVGYGLGLPDHTTLTNQGMGWSYFHETQNAELILNNDNLVLATTIILPSHLMASDEEFKGYSLGIDQMIDSKNKIGINLGRFFRDDILELQQNIHTIISLSERTYVQGEWGFRQDHGSIKSNMSSMLIRLSQEWRWGVRPYLQVEQEFESLIANSIAQNVFLGLEWYAINFFNLQFYLGVEKRKNEDDKKLMNLQGHFYF